MRELNCFIRSVMSEVQDVIERGEPVEFEVELTQSIDEDSGKMKILVTGEQTNLPAGGRHKIKFSVLR